VKKIDRFGKQPGQNGLMMELLWTDPQDGDGRGPSKRGVGVGFGPDGKASSLLLAFPPCGVYELTSFSTPFVQSPSAGAKPTVSPPSSEATKSVKLVTP
jgi:hypothetical protein